MDLIFSSKFTLEERRQIQLYVEENHGTVLRCQTLGKSKDRHLFLQRPKELPHLYETVKENKVEGIQKKYTIIEANPDVRLLLLFLLKSIEFNIFFLYIDCS